MFNSTKELRDELESAQCVIMDIGHQLNCFKRDMRSDIANLESAIKKVTPYYFGEIPDEVRIQNDIQYLKERYEQLDRWDNENRDKFRAIGKHLGIRIENGMHVVDDSSEED